MDRKMLSRLAAVLTQTIWGFSFISSKIAFEYASPVILLAYRFTVAFIVMHLIRTAAGIRFDMKGKPVKELMILGILQPIIYFLCENYGIEMSSASFSGVMIALIPIASLVGATIFLREIPTLKQVLFSILSVTGVIVMSVTPGQQQLATVPGAVLMACAVATAAAYMLLSRKLSGEFSPFERTYFMFAEGCVFFLLLAVLANLGDPGALVLPARSPAFIWSVLFLGILSSVVAFYSQNYSVTYLPVAEATVFANLSTVVAIVAGVLVLHEPVSPLTVPCTVIIIAGVIGVQLSARGTGMNEN